MQEPDGSVTHIITGALSAMLRKRVSLSRMLACERASSSAFHTLWAAWQIAQAIGVTERLELSPLSSLQAYYSLAGREIEHEIAPLLSATGLGLVCWSPLAGGMLSGKFDRNSEGDKQARRATTPFPPLDIDRTYDLIDQLRSIADAHGASPAQIALAWLLHRKTVSTVLLGAKRVE